MLWLVVLIVLVLAGAGYWWYRPGAREPGATPTAGTGGFASAPQPVGVGAVTKGDIDITLNALGTVVPLSTVTVQSQISGYLQTVGFTEGAVVKKGDFLAQIDPRPYQVTLEQDQAQLLRDQATLTGAQKDLDRYQKLAAQNSIAKQQADDQLYLVKQYEGTVKLDEAQIASAKLNLIYCRIVSPITGKAGLRQVDAGNYIQPSEPNGLVVITQFQPITVVFPIAEDNLPQLLKRLAAGAQLQAVAFDRSQTTKLANGTLIALDSQIDPTTGTVKLKAQFDNADDLLFPQQFVNIQLLVNVMKDVTVAPTAAIQNGAPGNFVFLIKGEKVAVTPVKLGPAEGERVAVVSGLTPGDRVVVDGADRLRDGSTITIPAAGGGTARPARKPSAPAVPGTPPVPAPTGEPGTEPSVPAVPGTPPAPPEGSNAGSSNPVRGSLAIPEANGPGYNPPPDNETGPSNTAKTKGGANRKSGATAGAGGQ